MFLPPKWIQKRTRWTRIPSDVDVLSIPGVLAPTEMERAFQRERARVDRNDQCFSIVVFRVGPKRRDDVRRLARLLVERVRAYDAVGAVDEDRIAALLPETDGEGSWTFADSAMEQFASLDLRVQCEVYTYPHPGEEEGEDDSYGRVSREDAAPSTPLNTSTKTGPTGVSRPQNETQGHVDGESQVSSATHTNPTRRSTGTDGAAVPAPEASATHLRAVSAPPLENLNPTPSELRESRPIKDMTHVFVERLPLYRRVVDVIVAGGAIIALLPLLMVAAVLVKFTSPGPIIFWQWRAGRGGKPFRFYKFRSMYKDAEARKNDLRLVNEKDGPIFKIKNDPRITPIGRWLRKLSIDELPQLFNVLVGDMTLVGPRPPVLDEVEGYEPWQRQRLDITGGLTCIWQVSGRSEVSFDDWMRMDIRYKQSRTLWMDVKLVFRTFGAVFSGRGAY